MSKKTKTIELVEDEKVINGVTVAELKLGEKSLGTVKPEDDKFTRYLRVRWRKVQCEKSFRSS